MNASHAPVVQGLRGPVTIDTFPNELLVKIFADLLSKSLYYYDYYSDGVRDTRKLLPAMLTSKKWLAVICGTPALWREILVRDSWVWLTVCLHRSQQLLVDISFYSFSMGTDFAQAQHILRPHKDRIASLMFRSVDCEQFGDHIALEEMSQLKLLNITVLHEHGADATMHNGICPLLPALKAPLLETLQVDGLTVYKPSSPFSRLRYLQIGGCVALRKTIRIAEFVSFLNDCVLLEKFDLELNALDAVLFDVPQGTGPMAVFPRLRELFIRGKVEEVSHMLSHMEVRPEVQVWVDTDDQEDIERAMHVPRMILPRDIPGCKLGILKSATRVMVDVPLLTIGPQLLCVTATQGDNCKHKIGIAARFAEERSDAEDGIASRQAKRMYFICALASICEIFHGAPVETLICRGEVSVVEERLWQTLLESFPRLRTLVIDDNVSGGPSEPLFQALTSPVCRDLEYVWLANIDGQAGDLEEIRKCIAWRTAQGAPLKRLRLELAAELVEGELPDVSDYRTEFARLVPESSLTLHDLVDGDRSDLVSAQIPKEFRFWQW